MNSEV